MALVIGKRLRIEGFIVGDPDFGPKYFKERNERLAAVSFFFSNTYMISMCVLTWQWLADGSITSKEHIDEGIDKAADAFAAMLEGRNFGKAILKVADPE
jgi:NADPH-dependent curcumin reductase CurA